MILCYEWIIPLYGINYVLPPNDSLWVILCIPFCKDEYILDNNTFFNYSISKHGVFCFSSFCTKCIPGSKHAKISSITFQKSFAIKQEWDGE